MPWRSFPAKGIRNCNGGDKALGSGRCRCRTAGTTAACRAACGRLGGGIALGGGNIALGDAGSTRIPVGVPAPAPQLKRTHRHQLFDRRLTLGAMAQRLIGHLLLHFENPVALLAFVFINWHIVFTYCSILTTVISFSWPYRNTLIFTTAWSAPGRTKIMPIPPSVNIMYDDDPGKFRPLPGNRCLLVVPPVFWYILGASAIPLPYSGVRTTFYTLLP